MSAEFRQIARDRLSGRWATAILVTFVAYLLGSLLTSGGGSFNLQIDEEMVSNYAPKMASLFAVLLTISSILGFVNFIISGVIRLGHCQYLLKQHDYKGGELRDLFSQFHRFGDGFCLNLLQSLYIFLWSLLLVIPGVVASYRYALAPFILLENPDMTASQAITASKEMMDGNKAELFFLDLSFIGWSLLSMQTLGIGSLWLNPYMNASRAAFYRHLSPRPALEAPTEF